MSGLHPESQVFRHCHVREEGIVLEDHGQVPVLRHDAVHRLAADAYDAPRGSLETGQHAQCRRLATPRRADHDEELTVFDLEVEVVDGGRSLPLKSFVTPSKTIFATTCS